MHFSSLPHAVQPLRMNLVCVARSKRAVRSVAWSRRAEGPPLSLSAPTDETSWTTGFAFLTPGLTMALPVGTSGFVCEAGVAWCTGCGVVGRLEHVVWHGAQAVEWSVG